MNMLEMKYALIDMKRDLMRAFNRLKYWYNGGYICTGCGAKIPIHYTHIQSSVNGKRVLLSNYHPDHFLCAHCIAERISLYFASFPVYSGCPDDWTGVNEKTINGIFSYAGASNSLLRYAYDVLGLDIRFGSAWWNGHYATESTLVKALTSNEVAYCTSVLAMKDGVYQMIDRNGVTMKAVW